MKVGAFETRRVAVTVLIAGLLGCGGGGGEGGAGASAKPGSATPPGRPITAAEVQSKSREAAALAGAYVNQELSQYRRDAEQKLSELDVRLAELKSRATSSEEWRELEEKRKAASDRLEQLRSASAETWRDVRASAEGAFADLEGTYERVRDRLASPAPSPSPTRTAHPTP